jgi:hypothetical protein
LSPQWIPTDAGAATKAAEVSGNRRERKKEAVQAAAEPAATAAVPAKDYRSSLQQAFRKLNAADYPNARVLLDDFCASWPGDLNGIFYRSVAAFRMSDDSVAQAGFETVIAGRDPVLTDNAIWYKALLLARQGRTADARRLLKDLAGTGYGEKAASLQRMLSDERP